MLFPYPLKEIIAGVPRHFLPGASGPFRKQTTARSFKGKLQGFGQTADKGCFRLIFSGSQAVIEVGHDKADIQFILEFMENVKKTNRIRASRDGDDDGVAFRDHSVARDGVFDLLESVPGGVHEHCPNQEVF
jgi:hypothetical protein